MTLPAHSKNALKVTIAACAAGPFNCEEIGSLIQDVFFLAALRAGFLALVFDDTFLDDARLETAAVLDAVFRAGAFFAAVFRFAGFFRAAGFLAVFLAVDFFAAGFLAAVFLAEGFLAAALFFAAVFLVAALFAAGLRAVVFLAADFFTGALFFAAGLLAAFLAVGFFAAGFLAAAFFFAGFLAVLVFMTLVPLLVLSSPKPAARRKKSRVISSLWFQTHWSSNGNFLLRLSKKSIDIARTLLLTRSEYWISRSPERFSLCQKMAASSMLRVR